MRGDIEINPGPKPSSWNLNRISAHNFIELSLLRAYIFIHNSIFYAYQKPILTLDSTISTNNNNLIIPGYDLYRADHPSNGKRGGIRIYYKNCFLLKITNIKYLQECINFDIKIGGKLCTLVTLYRSPNQSQD